MSCLHVSAYLQLAYEFGIRRVKARGDSKLVCQQVSKEWRITKPHLQVLCDTVHEWMRVFEQPVKVEHVLR